MNVVFLSPHFPAYSLQFCRQLKNAGATVLAIADTPFDQLPPAAREALTEYYRVGDMHNYDALVRALGYFTHAYGKIDRLDSLNEYWLETEARLRDDFNIFGVRGDSIATIRRKSVMKEKFRQAGVPVAAGRVVASEDEARALIAELGYPVVAKPDAGVGALDTFRLDNDTDLSSFFGRKPAVEYIIEAFVGGTIYSFDGLTDRHGNIIFATSHVFSQGIMETVNQGRHISYHSLRELPPELETFGRTCVEAFNVRERFFHIEFFQTAPTRYVALEVNIRPPGGYTTDMFNYACDIDIYRIWAELLVTGRSQFTFERKYHCCYASRKNSIGYRHSHEQILARYGRFIVQTASVPGVFSSALGDIGYIFRSPLMEDIHEITSFIQETMEH
ncbi:MAG: carboxylate--amine ligase [Desulfobulbaceae bacterium BRH_c16a]|nr:MAG: carboxylate--amine ligase [Desulfobulbaceae bacterium BRH_c16a]